MERIKNVRRFYWFQAAFGAMIIGPIIMIYLLEVKGLSFTQAMILNTSSSLALVIFDVPTGAFADHFSRKLCLSLGGFVLAISLFLYAIIESFFGLIFVEILFALGFSFISGADSAILYESLEEFNQEDMFQEIMGKAHSIQLLVQAVGSIVAGFIYDINVHLPLIVSSVFMLIAGLIAFSFKEGKRSVENSEVKYLTQIKDSCSFAINHTKIKGLLIYTMAFYIFYRMGFMLYQPYMSKININVKYFGIIFFIFNMVAAITSRNSHKIIKKTKRRTLTVLASLIFISFLLMSVIKVWYGFLAILLQQVARGLYLPVTRKYFNKYLESDKRATVLSFASLLTRLTSSLSYPLLGLLQDNGNVFMTHFVIGSTMVIMMIFVLKYLNKIMGRKEVLN